MLDTAAPFVLLDDARERGASPARLYQAPVEVIATRDVAKVRDCLERIREATKTGRHAAGFLTYEAGYVFEPSLGVPPIAGLPLLWFGVFDTYEEIAAEAVPALLPDPASAWLGRPQPRITYADYDQKLARILELIAAGDIYQANLTFRADVPFVGDPLALYAGLRERSRAGYGGIVWTGADMLLSASPELFFTLEDGALRAKPMKGTARDRAAAARLATDEKQRAENLMIVDLLRNDLSRVAVPGSVAVPRLFEIESYPTVHQMTSTVTATLAPERDAVDVIAALFPCGSITGAPKIRAMEVIAEVEDEPRGAYCGSIGRIDAGGTGAAFNVAIRTLHVVGETATLGLGSGIVADSSAPDEWAECLAKGAFVASPPAFDLIETMAFDPLDGIVHIKAHMERLASSAAVFGFKFDRHGVRNDLQAATFRLREPVRVRLILSRTGATSIQVTPLPDIPEGPVPVAIVARPTHARDIRLIHKTTDRRIYPRRPDGAFEIVMTDADGFLTEGSFTSLFVADATGRLRTPPLAHGLLPGILRADLLADGRAYEAELTASDLQNTFFVGNSLRGLLPARLLRL
ncbi:putative branched-chain-amino-acid aminotransferase [Sphingomonas antarctica]|uniref:aminodeoxychorismate synthase component I n=1 Tax=Sphingomonas antarctica TaxID=2040274 RepID=UPI0039E84A06